MTWQEALKQLIEIAPKLAFKPELLTALQGALQSSSPPSILQAQMEVMMAVVKQNRRLADLHGYPSLEAYAKRVEVAVANVTAALKASGVAPAKSPQAGLV